MCYACHGCGRCSGKETENIFTLPKVDIPCFMCDDGYIDPDTGVCDACGFVAFAPAGAAKGDRNCDDGGR